MLGYVAGVVTVLLAGIWSAITMERDANVRLSVVETHATSRVAAVPAVDLTPDAVNAVLEQYCVGCHNDRMLTGNLSLESFDASRAANNPVVAERVIRKLHAGMMPPPGRRAPQGDTLQAVALALETIVDTEAVRNPRAGTRAFQRLNRAEYKQVVRELLGLDVDPARWLPPETLLANFDNMSDAQALSPTLLDAYLNAAVDISWLAVGNAAALPAPTTYNTTIYVSQLEHIEGAPYGTRGGIVVTHDFPADGQYVFEFSLRARSQARYEDLDVSIDGEGVAYLAVEGGVPIVTDSVFIFGGQHTVAAAFVQKAHGPVDDLLSPHGWSQAGGGAPSYGTTFPTHLQSMRILGPFHVTGVAGNAARRSVFTCYPTSMAEEIPCATAIITRIAAAAYRRPVTDADMAGLMGFYAEGAVEGGFENGVRRSLQAILSSPHFIFRLERQPENARPNEAFELSDLDLASRLSFFLWGTAPDQELLALATAGDLQNARVLEAQARRMLADPRSSALATRFAGQWLRLADMYKVRPDGTYFPDLDENMTDLMRRETEMFFENLVREDRNVLELLTADYTFVNERLARHYGITGVVGTDFRRVEYPDARRRGLLGQGSFLLQTSMATRTSPVLRGKWVMEVLLGTPPPPPPPDVPDLEVTSGVAAGRLLTTRERLAEHRANPTCNSCHLFMDPIGNALDNFDVTGRWRMRENGTDLDTRGVFYDGTEIASPSDLSAVLMKRPTAVVRNFAENLLAYAMGRPVDATDMPAVRAIAARAALNDNHMSSFVLGVVTSTPFRMKQAQALSTTASN